MKLSAQAALFVLLCAFWALLSGMWDPLLIALGLGSCALVALLAGRMQITDQEGLPRHIRPLRFAAYGVWLIGEIIRSNIAVVRAILAPRMHLSPSIFRVPAGDLEDFYQVVYANSITLTPGTVSIDLGDDWIEIHALTREAADSLRDEAMHRRVARLDRRA